MGGMQALQFAVDYPNFADDIISLAATYATRPWTMSFNKVAMEAIRRDPRFKHGNYAKDAFKEEGLDGLAIGRIAGHISYLSPHSMDDKFGRNYVSNDGLFELFGRYEVERYMEYNTNNFSRIFDPLSYLYIVKAINTFNLSRGYDSLHDAVSRIKAKVHMYQAEWDSVASLTDRIIGSGKYSLLTDFREVFSINGENSRESLFEVQSSTLGKITGDQTFMEYAYVQGPRGNTPSSMQGWGFCTPSQNLIDFYAGRGEVIRPATTLLYRGTKTPEGDSIRVICSNPVYNGKVYTPAVYNNWNYNGYGFDHNVRILRYSDILLMYAEARVNGATAGTTSGMTADDAVNMVRERAGLLPLSGVTLQEIWNERRAELAMEQDRFFDLIRTGEAATALSSKGFVVGKHEVYPIPSAQMQLNSTLVQNNGYN